MSCLTNTCPIQSIFALNDLVQSSPQCTFLSVLLPEDWDIQKLAGQKLLGIGGDRGGGLWSQEMDGGHQAATERDSEKEITSRRLENSETLLRIGMPKTRAGSYQREWEQRNSGDKKRIEGGRGDWGLALIKAKHSQNSCLRISKNGK